MKIILKLIGLVIALAAFGYRVFCMISNYDSITIKIMNKSLLSVVIISSLIIVLNVSCGHQEQIKRLQYQLDSLRDEKEESDNHIFKSVEIKQDGSKYIFDAVLNPLAGDVSGYDMSDIFKVSVSVEMAAKITAYKNGTVDGNKITFDLSDMSKETELYAECKTASIVPVVICGILVVASLVAFFVLRKRK